MGVAVGVDAVIGLGSNLGDRLAHLRNAARELSVAFELRAFSHVYETEPVGPAQPDYLNAAVRLRGVSDVLELLRTLQHIERRGGRLRSAEGRWGARTLDLDLLWADGLVLSTPELELPHPRLTERAFALRPLLDVAADAVDPRTGRVFAAPLPNAAVRRTLLSLWP